MVSFVLNDLVFYIFSCREFFLIHFWFNTLTAWHLGAICEQTRIKVFSSVDLGGEKCYLCIISVNLVRTCLLACFITNFQG